MSGEKVPNRLVHEKSPYLLQHAHNPVDWYPYGEEAFAKAREEDKPIFLSIGYSTCHWCHVMERESFEDPATAAVMNELYVNIKVDREERPDVDQVYMQAVMYLTRQGGWPLNVWLDHELRPFYAGTYFPPRPMYGRSGFVQVLRSLAGVFKSQRDSVADQAARLVELMAQEERSEGTVDGAALSERACAQLSSSYDEHWGGFGGAPKFPRPVALMLLAHRLSRNDQPRGRQILEHTHEMMWRGGLYDHVGGGYARYSVDERWLVPHFEKMLYDNAQLVESALDAWLLGGKDAHRRRVEDVLAWCEREMLDPEGAFFSAQDADSEGEEGKFYLFTLDELKEVLGDEAEQAARVLGASGGGNFEGSNILHWPQGVSAAAESEGLERDELLERYASWRERLYAWREQRVRPGLDDKQLVAWNGLMIHAFARAGVLFGESRYVETARRAARFLEERCVDSEGLLLRRYRDGEARFAGALEDYAGLAWAHLGLFEATGEARDIESALRLVEKAEELFLDPENGGYFFASEQPDLVVRLKDSEDNATPSGNGLLAMVLARLGSLLDREELRDRARRTIQSFRTRLGRIPEAFPCLLMAAVEVDELPRTYVVAGSPKDPAFDEALRPAHASFMPGRVVIPLRDDQREALEALGVPVKGKDAPEGEARSYLCEDGACLLVTS